MKKILVGLALAALLMPYTVGAFTGMSGDNISISDPITDDLYVAGGSIVIQNDITGDLHAAGGNIRVEGNVSDDVIAAGGNIKITGAVAGDVRIVGGDITIEGNIGDDLLIGGGNIVIAPSAVINGDLLVAGGQIEVWGTVKGNIKADSDTLGLYGPVGGSVMANMEDVRFSEKTKIAGDFIYHSRNANIKIDENLVGGKVEQIKLMPEAVINHNERGDVWAARIGIKFFSLVTSLLLGLLLILIVPMFFQNSAKMSKTMPAASLGLGVALYGGLLLASFFSAITIIGIKVGALFFLAFFMLLLIGKVLSGYFVGYLIFNPKKMLTGMQGYGLFAIGLIIIELVEFVPYIGKLAVLIVSLMAIGGLLFAKHSIFKTLRSKNLV